MHIKLLFFVSILFVTGCSNDYEVYWGVRRDYPMYFDSMDTILRIPSTKVKGHYDFFRSFPLEFKVKEDERVFIEERWIEPLMEDYALCFFTEYYGLHAILKDTVVIGDSDSRLDIIIPEEEDAPRWGQAIFAKKKHVIGVSGIAQKHESNRSDLKSIKRPFDSDKEANYYLCHVSVYYIMNNDYSRFGDKYVYPWALEDENHSICSLYFTFTMKQDDLSQKWYLDQITAWKQFEDFTPYENYKNFEEIGWNKFISAMRDKKSEWTDLRWYLLEGKFELKDAVKDPNLPQLPVSDYTVLLDHE